MAPQISSRVRQLIASYAAQGWDEKRISAYLEAVHGEIVPDWQVAVIMISQHHERNRS